MDLFALNFVCYYINELIFSGLVLKIMHFILMD